MAEEIRMTLEKKTKCFGVFVFGLDDPNDPDDFSYSPPGQPRWMDAYQSGPDLMTAIAITMAWVEDFADNDESKRWLVMVSKGEVSPGSLQYDNEGPDSVVAQWVYEDGEWHPYASGGPHPVPAPWF